MESGKLSVDTGDTVRNLRSRSQVERDFHVNHTDLMLRSVKVPEGIK